MVGRLLQGKCTWIHSFCAAILPLNNFKLVPDEDGENHSSIELVKLKVSDAGIEYR